MTILGTRPEIIRLSRIMQAMDRYFNHIIVYTGQSYDYEMSGIFFKELGIRKPDYLLNVKSDSLGGQIGNIIQKSENVMFKEKPDAILVLGDTNSSLAAIIAKRLKILIFHMEAGNRCFDWEVPEETNRVIVDVISDYNLAYSENSRLYLINNGVHPSKIFVTGSPLFEVYKYYKVKIDKSDIIRKLKLSSKKYFIVSTHREENVDNPLRLRELFVAFNEIAKKYKFPIIVTLHPRTRKLLSKDIEINSLIQLHKPFGIFDYIKLQKNAYCVLSDSGSIQEESSMLDFNAIQIRANMERQEAFDAGSILLAGFSKASILSAIQVASDMKDKNIILSIPSEYTENFVSAKIVKLMMGFTSIRKYHNK